MHILWYFTVHILWDIPCEYMLEYTMSIFHGINSMHTLWDIPCEYLLDIPHAYSMGYTSCIFHGICCLHIMWDICMRILWDIPYIYIVMITSSNVNIFRVTGPLCGEFTGRRWIPWTKASDGKLWCFYDLRLNKWLSKQWWGWWYGIPSHPLWRHCDGIEIQCAYFMGYTVCIFSDIYHVHILWYIPYVKSVFMLYT